jgi:Domain of unknown function (DUF4126)
MSAGDLLNLLGRTLGFSFAAGINLYATVAILGLATRFGWVDLPPQYRVFDNNWIIGVAVFLYVVEFIADKIPWVDTVWDAIHTVIRPAGGALIAVASIGHAQPWVQAAAAIVGAMLATSTHVAKSGTRAAANTSPEPFSNWALSFAEDGFVLGLGLLALTHPIAAGIVVLVALAVIVMTLRWLVRGIRRRWRAPAGESRIGARR